MLGFMMSLVLMMGLQDGSTIEPSRSETLTTARQEKAANLKKPMRASLERALYEIKEKRLLERFQAGFHGFHPILGGIRSGSGFGGGTWVESNGIRTSGQVSLKGYQKYELRVTAPLHSDLFFADFRATYRNLPQERFFGTGQNSKKENQVNFRLEDTNYAGRVGITPARHVKTGIVAGWLDTNVGSGTSLRLPTIETVYKATDVAGMANQPDYLQAGAFFEADYRDQPGNPRSGGLYTASYTSFQDRKLGRYDFGQYNIEAQQYFPFFHQRRVIALRAKTTMTQTASDQEVPFFMQPTLGGSEDLRGYNEFRFRDKNMVVLNAEYRWEAFSGLDLAAFADAGQVAPRPSDLHLSNFEKSYGVGFRFNSEKSVFLRLDVGFSKEGQHLFVKFGHVF
jgi:outer membrane protein assembly factor BamA